MKETVYESNIKGIEISVIWNDDDRLYTVAVTQDLKAQTNEVVTVEAIAVVDEFGNDVSDWIDNGYDENGTPMFGEVLDDFYAGESHGIGEEAHNAIMNHIKTLQER